MQYIARKNVRKSCVIKNVSLGKKNQKTKAMIEFLVSYIKYLL